MTVSDAKKAGGLRVATDSATQVDERAPLLGLAPIENVRRHSQI